MLTTAVVQHSICAGLAAAYCVFLGLFALFQGRSKLYVLFAAYNFSNALWNLGDAIYIFDLGTGKLEPLLRITGVGGCFLIPFFVHFGYEVVGISTKPHLRMILRCMYALGAVFAILHQTPLLHTSVLNSYEDVYGYWSKPGPLFPFFLGSILITPLITLTPLLRLYRDARGLKRKQATYLLLADVLAFLAVGFFLLSFVHRDWPWIYYGLQAAIGFVFAYTIFQHNLIHLNVALKRAALLSGLYFLLALIIVPVGLVFYKYISSNPAFSMGMFFSFLAAVVCAASFAPVAYSAFVRRSTLFHEQAVWHITHELKTPLATIQSAKQILDEEMSKDSVSFSRMKDYMAMIETNTTRLERFVHEILEYGKADKELKAEFDGNVDVKQLIDDVIGQFPMDRERFNVECPSVAPLKGHREGLRQVLANILMNATKFAPTGPISIRVEQNGSVTQVSVVDQGRGIDQRDLERIFLPFTQSKPTGGFSKGSGLGLAIARRWVEAHGGRIWAESDGEGRGTTLVFALPLSVTGD